MTARFLMIPALLIALVPLLQGQVITPGAKVYVAPMADGFDVYVSAALRNKNVPLVVVISRDSADYILSGTSNSQKASWAKIAFAGNLNSSEEASITLADVKSGVVVYAYNVNKGSSVHGKQSTAEACAKHLKEQIEKGQKPPK